MAGAIKMIAVGSMVFLYSAQSLVITYTQNAKGGYEYKPNSAVLMTEFTKLLVASTFLFMDHSQGNSPKVTVDRKCLRYAVPAALYAVHNNMVFLGLEALDAPTFQLLNNLKIVIAGILTRTFLNRPMTILQWLGILLLTVGQAVASLKTGQAESAKQASFFAGLMIMIFLSFLSSFAGIYNEFLLKGSDDSTHWQNMQLYAFSVVVCFVQNAFAGSSTVEDPSADQGFFHGFSASTWLVICVSAFMGQAVSFVLKYADNLTNRFATAGSLVVTAIGAYNIFGTPVTLPFGIGVLILAVAFALYYIPPETLSKMDHELCGPVTAAEPEKDEEA